MGGILFIDEAYALGGSNYNDYGNEAIQTLLKRMEDESGKFYVFAAGYPENMDNFIKSNPGLSSRFDKTLKFFDYSPEELMLIAVKMLKDQSFKLSIKAYNHLNEYIHYIWQFRDKYFGNARTVRLIIQEIIKKHNIRLVHEADTNEKRKNIQTISFDDVKFLELKTESLLFTRRTIGFGNHS
jgi:SpoVK/Ycf46/Vps4 family AAA+-type ATPase